MAAWRRIGVAASLVTTVALAGGTVARADTPQLCGGLGGTTRVELDATFEVPSNASTATGKLSFIVASRTGATRVTGTFKNLKNVVSIKVYKGAKGTIGPEAITVYTSAAGKGAFKTLDVALADGCAFSKLLRTEDQPLYVNVATNDGKANTNNIPGDFPAGEIRGQFPGGGDE